MSGGRRIAPGTFVYAGALVLAAVGLTVAVLGPWRVGTSIIGAVLVAGGVIRVAMPDETAGLLAVRGRWFDVGWMVVVGAALGTLAVVVPRGF